MDSRHPLVIGLIILSVFGCTEGKLALYARENAPTAVKFIENTIDEAVNLFAGQKNQSTTKPDAQSTTKPDAQSTTKPARYQLEEKYQLCEYSTSDFGKKWETKPFLKWVQEAKEKGLTLVDCARLLSG